MSCVAAALRSNAAIRDLCLDVILLKKEENHPFCEALKVHQSLKSLHLIAWGGRSTLSVASVAEVVETLTALTSLQLTNFHADISEYWALVRSLSSVGIVQELAIVSCKFSISKETRVLSPGPGCEDDLHPGVSITDRLFLHMVRTLTSLLELRMPLSFTTDKKRLFFEALDKHGCIEEVHFGGVNEHPYRVIRDTGNRWVIERVGWHHLWSERMLEGERVRSVYLFEDDSVERLRRFSQLRMLQELTSLTVSRGRILCNMKAGDAEILAQFLRETRSLNEVKMDFYAKRAQSRVLLDAIRHNTSITVLVVENWCRCEQTAGLLVDIVCSSKRIRAFTYNLKCTKTYLVLAKAMQTNFTLLSVSVRRNDAAARHLGRIQEVLARNNALPFRAAWFVTGRTVDKRGAEALELLGPDPVVVSEVREMLSVGEIEAEEATRRKLSDLDDMNAFMRAAGVVRESVVCDCSHGLDALPFFCWLHLRQYLRVADIVDRPEMR
ncbi:hypothetical protein V5799_005921 [Amblyomma americanum]|uniref:Uncharacterized protein n=1 Tax=Amblyomma americanum TaxID=6943 RepID=A0AAQ4DXV8_AMBAM